MWNRFKCFCKGNYWFASVQNMSINTLINDKVCIAALLTEHIRFYFNVFSCVYHLAPSAGSYSSLSFSPGSKDIYLNYKLGRTDRVAPKSHWLPDLNMKELPSSSQANCSSRSRATNLLCSDPFFFSLIKHTFICPPCWEKLHRVCDYLNVNNVHGNSPAPCTRNTRVQDEE